MKKQKIDNGRDFDFGRTSKDYAKYRDIYPKKIYDILLNYNIGKKGQKILDIGTGTGVIPRALYSYGADWTATDISKNQIEEAQKLSKDMNINYIVSSTENLNLEKESFDTIIACQCYWYFNHEIVAKKLSNLLKKGGKLYFLYVAWLPLEDEIAKASEDLVLKYNPFWTGNNETMKPISVPKEYFEFFEVTNSEESKLPISFTRKSWNGRMKSCRGIGASLDYQEINRWEDEHLKMLKKIAPKEFDIKHYFALVELTKK